MNDGVIVCEAVTLGVSSCETLWDWLCVRVVVWLLVCVCVAVFVPLWDRVCVILPLWVSVDVCDAVIELLGVPVPLGVMLPD